VAVVVPGGALLVWALVGRNAHAWRTLGRMACDRWAWALGAVIALPWYAYAWCGMGRRSSMASDAAQHRSLPRGRSRGMAAVVAYYLVFLPLLMLPWTRCWFRWHRRLAPLAQQRAAQRRDAFPARLGRLRDHLLLAVGTKLRTMCCTATHRWPCWRRAGWFGAAVSHRVAACC